MDSKKKIILGGMCSLGVILIIIAIILLMSPKKYIVSFDTLGGNIIASQEVKSGEKVSKPVDPSKENFDFVKWIYQNNDYDFNTPVKSDMTLTAVWAEKEKEKFAVTLKLGDKIETLEVSELNEIDLDSLSFDKKDGYDVVWYLNGEKYDFTTPLTNALTLEGKYEKVVSYTVKFSSNSNTKVANQTVKSGETVKESSAITKYGYIFDGWYLNNKKYDFSTPVTKNITLVAKWNEDESIPRYTVTFDSDGGSKVNAAKVIENNTVGKPGNPTKSGFKFKEWQLDGKTYNFSTKVTKDITLKAVWTELENFVVTFRNDDGSVIRNVTVQEGNTVSKPSNPTKSGYTFKEWQLDGKAYNFSNKVTKDITLVAVYTQNEVKQDTYEIVAKKVDNFSNDFKLTVLKNGSQISVREIKYTDGNLLCSGSNMTVEKSDFEGEKTLLVVLNDGSTVRATVK